MRSGTRGTGMIVRGVEVEVLVHGRSVQEYLHRGQTFIEGRRGSEYVVRVRNNTNRRALAVVSVDGLSVMNGQEATRKDNGYVINAQGFVDIPGWRLDDKEVAHFVFGDLPEAYASKMGKPRNIGVIGVSVFHEKPRPPVMLRCFGPTIERDRSPVFSGGIGTGFGRPTEHEVSRVRFDRDYTPIAELVMRYDDAEGLQGRGITITTAHTVQDRVISANPFPGECCTPPPGWHP